MQMKRERETCRSELNRPKKASGKKQLMAGEKTESAKERKKDKEIR
jgi:hypothetical protein